MSNVENTTKKDALALRELTLLMGGYCRKKDCYNPRFKPEFFCAECLKKAAREKHKIERAREESQSLRIENSVYFIQAQSSDGYIKVGRSNDVKSRISALQTSSPYRLKLLFSMPAILEIETLAHKKYAEFNVSGEWFKPAEIILSDIQCLKDGEDLAFIYF
jgi:hypothetical protein